MGIVMGPGGRPTIGVAWDPRSDMTLAYNYADAKWTPVKLRKYDAKKGKEGEYIDFTLAEDEELNPETLNALKNALDDLKIVDVKRKPQGLSQNLKAGEEFTNNQEAFRDLMSKGFAATTTPDGGGQEIISSDGEVVATMKNGAEYVLRFGNLTNASGGHAKDEKEGKAQDKAAAGEGKDGKDAKSSKGGVHRYLFVMARFNKDAVKQPELAKLPDLPAKAENKTEPAAPGTANPPAQKEGEAAGTDKKDAGENKDAAQNKDAAATPASKADEPAKQEAADTAKAATDAEKKDAAPKAGENAEKKDAATENKDAAKTGTEPGKELEKVIAERQQIEKENQRKLDEYQSLLKKGEQNVKDLNLRFGDWYFVVDDDVFQKVRLSREKVIKKKEKKEGEAAKEGKDAATPPAGIPGVPSIPGATK